MNTTFSVEHNFACNFYFLRLYIFIFNKSRFCVSVSVSVFLQFAFACFVANRTVERVVQKQKFEHTLATTFHCVAIGYNVHPFGYICSTCYCWLWHPRNFLRAILIFDKLTRCSVACWHTRVNQTHSARACYFQFWMIAKIWDFHADTSARFKNILPCDDFVIYAVDVDMYNIVHC